MAEKYPVYKIEDVYHFNKYAPKASAALNAWSWVQLLMVLISISYLFGNIAAINSASTAYIFWYGAFVFLSVYSMTELMDRNPYAIGWEILRCGLGIGFLVYQDDWFGASGYITSIKFILGVYFILSIIITGWFVYKHYREDRKLALSM